MAMAGIRKAKILKALGNRKYKINPKTHVIPTIVGLNATDRLNSE
jgi:hypothetical protein